MVVAVMDGYGCSSTGWVCFGGENCFLWGAFIRLTS